MAKLREIPESIKYQIANILSEFGSARWKALLKYTEIMILSSDEFTEAEKERSEQLAEKTLSRMIRDGLIEVRRYDDDRIAVPLRHEDISLGILNAFEVFAAICREVYDSDQHPEFCYAGKTAEYPFDFIISASMQGRLYRLIVYGHDANIRIGFFNDTYERHKCSAFVTILVIPDSYSWEEFTDTRIRGNLRIAFIREVNRKRKRYICELTDIMSEE